MKHIISKTVLALWPGGGLINDDYFTKIRDKLFNENNGYQKKEYDNITDKKNQLSPTGFGSNDRGHNPGAGVGLERDYNESKDRGLSSGYNDGEKADDETGPGFSSEKSNPYYGSDVLNDLFLDLNVSGATENDKVKKNLKKILDGPSMPKQHIRFQKEM